MIRWINNIGGVTHAVCYAETPRDEKIIARPERSLPCIERNNIDAIPATDHRAYRLAQTSLTHEREANTFDIYFRERPQVPATRP